MKGGNILLISVVTLITILLLSQYFSILTSAQIGEEAGPLNFQVMIGHNQTLQMHVGNSGNQTIYYKVYVGSISQQDNQTSPTVTVNPQNGSIAPHATVPINVTVFMPLNDTPGKVSWSVIISAVQTNNASNSGGGAVLSAGVAKIASIVAVSSTTTVSTTSTVVQRSQNLGSGLPSIPESTILIIVGVVVVVVVIVAIVALVRKNGISIKVVSTKRQKTNTSRKKR